jgi:hypothetical protein
MLIRKHEGSKKVHLNVDSLSYWMATNNARDNVLKYRYLDQYGPTEGLRRLSAEHPYEPGSRSRQRSSADPVTLQTQIPLEGVV